MTTSRLSLYLVVLALVGCQSSTDSASPAGAEVEAVQPELSGLAIDAAPASWAPALDGAKGAMRSLGGKLRERVGAEMKAGGPVQAIAVCRDEASALTAEVAGSGEIELGRTSHKLRNPDNAVPAWLSTYLAEVQALPAARVRPRVFDLGDRVGLVRPIGTAEVCTRCHGGADSLDPAVRALLADAYPEDRATGFSPGDLRGLFWATAPKGEHAATP